MMKKMIFSAVTFLPFLIVVFLPVFVLAANTTYQLNVPFGTKTTVDIGDGSNPLFNYISVWYGLIIGSIGILATVMIMYGGFKWLTSHGNTAQISDAKEKIISAITGLLLAFLSFTILNLINPRLVQITTPGSDQLTPINFKGNFIVSSVGAKGTMITAPDNANMGDLINLPESAYSVMRNPGPEGELATGMTREDFISKSINYYAGELEMGADELSTLEYQTLQVIYGDYYDQLRNQYPDGEFFPLFSDNTSLGQAETDAIHSVLDPQSQAEIITEIPSPDSDTPFIENAPRGAAILYNIIDWLP